MPSDDSWIPKIPPPKQQGIALMENEQSTESLAHALQKAICAYESIERDRERAHAAATAALNALNRAQKAFDDRVAELRQSANRSSDWGRALERACVSRLPEFARVPHMMKEAPNDTD